MSRVVFLCGFFISLTFGDTKSATIVDDIINSLTLEQKISIYTQNRDFLKETKSFKQSFDCQNADMIIVKNVRSLSKKCINKKKMIILTDYKSYQNNQEAIGVIFMQKGRLNLAFREKRLKEFSLRLPNKYKHYIE